MTANDRKNANDRVAARNWIARGRLPVSLALLAVGAALLALGISRGEPDVVLRKAIMICLECIGIG